VWGFNIDVYAMSICYIKDGEQSFVFDSFGSVPPKRLVSYLNGTLNLNNDRIQNFDEVTCGHLCVTALKMYSSGVQLEDISSVLNASNHIWRDYVTSYKRWVSVNYLRQH
jgi:hypothetical protein